MFPSSEISIVPLPVESGFLAILRVRNVTSSHNNPAEIGEGLRPSLPEDEGGFAPPP